MKRSRDSGDFNGYVEKRANENNIKVNTVSVEHLKTRSSQLHILSVYQQFEGYLIDLKKEIPFSLDLDNGNESLLKRMLKALNDSDKVVSQIEIDILEYYKNIRNVFMHPDIDDTKYDQISERIKNSVSGSYQALNRYEAPNKYNELNFDDFILFTKVAKDVAEKLCIVACPSAIEIAELIRKTDSYRGLNKYRNNRVRFGTAAETLCRCEYSINKEDSKDIVDNLWALA
jgi:hypothetical protein